MDQAAISKAYRESEWEAVCKSLEGYLRNTDEKRIDADERIFAYKHLGVIYASDSATQNRAESYFNLLLQLSPNIEIMDMYVSKKISEFFRDVKQDFKKQKAYSSNYDAFGRQTKGAAGPLDSMSTAGGSTPANRPYSKPKQAKIEKEDSQSWFWWTLGIAAATGVGTGAYYLSQEKKPEREKKVTDVTPQ